MKVAVVLRGISWIEKYKHWSGQEYHVDFRDNFKNLKYNLIDPLKADVYCCTYDHAFIHILKYLYEPIHTDIVPMESGQEYVVKMMLNSLNAIKQNYDLIIMTRFDINMTQSILDFDYDMNKVNFLCEANGNLGKTLNDDTLIIFGGQYLTEFKRVLSNLRGYLCHHRIYDTWSNKTQLKFIVPGKYEIAKERPYIYFNREISYRPSRFVLNHIKPATMVTYHCDKCSLKLLGHNHYLLFKPSHRECIVYLNVESTTTLLEICFRVDQPCLLQDRKVCGYVCERFIVPRKNIDIPIKLESTLLEIKDISIKSIEQPQKIHFVSFYTQGKPHDLCLDMTNAKERYEKAISPYVDTVKFYTPAELNANPETHIYVKPINSTPNPYNPGVHNIGFLKWKPYIILKHLEEAGDNDIVYYRDSNVLKYPSILENVEETRDLMNLVMKDMDFFVPVENWPDLKMKKNVKREILEALGKYDHSYLEAFGYNSSIVICKKTDTSFKILKEWLNGCMKDQLINYDIYKPQHPEYGWNVQEQSILNVIYKNYDFKTQYNLNMRKFNLASLTKVPRIAVIIAGEMRNYDNPEIIELNNKNLLHKYNCDIFVSTWNKKGFSFNHGNYKSEGSSIKIYESDITNTYKNLIDYNIEDYDEWYDSLDDLTKQRMKKGFYNNHSTVLCPNTIYPQLYKIWDAIRMKTAYEHKMNFKYDIVIRFRPDMGIINSIDLNLLSPFKLYHLNPPKIYEPERIYDIFFYGDSHTMNIISDTWKYINELMDMPFDNVLPEMSACRVLYLQALINNIEVIDISQSIGDIYRNENVSDFIGKIKGFNRPVQMVYRGVYGKFKR